MIKSTPFEAFLGMRMPQEVLIERVMRVIENELTPLQQETLTAYYFRQRTIPQIAADRGRNKSTVCRTLHRAERRLVRFLQH